MITNVEIENAFELLGKLMELHGENSFKAKSYLSAAYNIGKLNDELALMDPLQMEVIPGIGKAIQEKIMQLIETGTITQLQELLNKTPLGVLEMMQIKGLGPKKVATIWNELGIESIGELEYACLENRLTLLKGFGEKTQQAVLNNIEFLKQNKDKFLFATAESFASDLIKQIKHEAGFENISLTGSVYRKDNVLENIEILIGDTSSDEIFSILSELNYDIEEKENHFLITGLQFPVIIYTSSSENYFAALVNTSGTEEHKNILLKAKPDFEQQHFNSEEEVYQYADLPFTIPEMRNGTTEFEWSKKYNTKDLIEATDIKGIVHAHSKWSDGINTIREMAQHCIEMDLEYLVISDHSQSAFYANGLKPDSILKQHDEIDKLNVELAPFKIFKSIEADILYDGQLDYTTDILKTFDCVIVSVHSILKMTEEKATARLITAIENPYTTILGHLTGRLLTSRPGYPIDHKKIIDACAANRVIIELNANPWRLDIDWKWIYYAMEKDVKISINPDAHNLKGNHDIYFGTISARKGGLVKSMLFNAMNANEMEAYFVNRKLKILNS